MNVFIDTNILLSFFHFSKDDLDALQNVFASHEQGGVRIHLTQQVHDEFMRNREVKIKDALRRFQEVKYPTQFPYFMRSYEEFESIRKMSVSLQRAMQSILRKAESDILGNNLPADRLTSEIFKRFPIHPTTEDAYSAARMRTDIGNPPGKGDSIGDAINWAILLDSVPAGQDLHVVSEDGDFFSSLNEDRAHPFLVNEWSAIKGASLHAYRTLSSFVKAHFDGVTFSFDKVKESLIEDLRGANSFANTHYIVKQLETYQYFSLSEVRQILDAVVSNGQVGGIVTDWDVSDFINRIAVPRKREIVNPDYLAIIEEVLEEQGMRDR